MGKEERANGTLLWAVVEAFEPLLWGDGVSQTRWSLNSTFPVGWPLSYKKSVVEGIAGTGSLFQGGTATFRGPLIQNLGF